jgi:hypothetical protein
MTSITDTLHEDQYTVLIIYRSVLPIMKKVSGESCSGNQDTNFVFINFFLENRAVYEVMWKNTVQSDRPQMTIRRVRTACLIPKSTKTHPEYVIFNAFRLRQWLY